MLKRDVELVARTTACDLAAFAPGLTLAPDLPPANGAETLLTVENVQRLVRYWVTVSGFFYPIPRPLPPSVPPLSEGRKPRSIREGELNMAEFVIIC